jgi:xylose isomerase
MMEDTSPMAVVDIRPQATRRTKDELVAHMNNFSLDMKFSAGIWFAAPGGGRFHDRYTDRMTIPEALDVYGELAEYGLSGIEAHYPGEVNEDNWHHYEKLEKDTGIKLVGLGPGLFYDAQFEWGALSSPYEEVQVEAIDIFARALQFAKDTNTPHIIHWPGIDGWENSFAQDFFAMRDRFARNIATAMDRVPGVRVCMEPKPYEPRGRIIYGSTYEGILLGMKVESMLENDENRAILKDGHALMAMNPEMGHVLMGFEDAAYSYSLCMEYGRLGHTHWNAQPLGNYDQDLNVGVISPEQMEASLYAMKMYGYDGYLGVDLNPERMSSKQAIKNSLDAIRAMNERIDSLDHEKVIGSTHDPARNRGWLESYMIRQRWPDTELPPAPVFEK